MEYRYRIAEVSLSVIGPDGDMYTEHGVLSPFVDDNCGEADYTLVFELPERLPAPEGEPVYRGSDRMIYFCGDSVITYYGYAANLPESAYIRTCRRNDCCFVQCKRDRFVDGITPKTVLRAMEAEHFIVHHKGLILHAAYIRHGDEAILFTAPSGTGKSTQADLWVRHRGAELLNGDRAIVKVKNGIAYAYGIPFSGSSRVSKNVTLPVEAIVYLSQSEQVSISGLNGFEAFRRLWEGCTMNVWDKTDVECCVQTAMDVLASAPFYHLQCRPDLEAVTALETALQKNEQS